MPLAARLLLARAFGTAGLAKLADRDGSRQALIDFSVRCALATPLGILLLLAELIVAVVLLLRPRLGTAASVRSCSYSWPGATST
jgi:hypothetical protein